MNYYKVTFKVNPPDPARDILMAELGDAGFESFEDNTDLVGYVQEGQFVQDEITAIVKDVSVFAKVTWNSEYIPGQNWNSEWEKNFSSITINDKAIIRAEFHTPTNHPYQFIISPKMAFGTGHHETTRMMAQALFDLDLKNKAVLDMGCGTGILAVIAEKLGAATVLGIDIEEPAIENSCEHFALNHCKHCSALLGDASSLVGKKFDYILANINRNVLTRDMLHYAEALIGGGQILFSGFFTSDIEIIDEAATKYGLLRVSEKSENNWAQLAYCKAL